MLAWRSRSIIGCARVPTACGEDRVTGKFITRSLDITKRIGFQSLGAISQSLRYQISGCPCSKWMLSSAVSGSVTRPRSRSVARAASRWAHRSEVDGGRIKAAYFSRGRKSPGEMQVVGGRMGMALIIFFNVRGGGRGGKNTTAEKYSHVISWHGHQEDPKLPTAWTNVLWSSLIKHDT
jgi:hypothetical protein